MFMSTKEIVLEELLRMQAGEIKLGELKSQVKRFAAKIKNGRLEFLRNKWVLVAFKDADILWDIDGEPHASCDIFWAETLLELINKI